MNLKIDLIIASLISLAGYHSLSFADQCKANIENVSITGYEGQCSRGMAEGDGKAYSNNKEVYSGNFISGVPHGHITFRYEMLGGTGSEDQWYWLGKKISMDQYDELASKDAESIIAWQATEADNTSKAYKDFSRVWPNSTHMLTAWERAASIEYLRLNKKSSDADYERFVNEYPNTKEANVAQEVLAGRKIEEFNRKKAKISRKNLATNLRELQIAQFCDLYGQTIRDDLHREYEEDYGPIESVVRLKAIIKELSRRRLSVSEGSAKSGKFRIGSTQCTMYAAWGVPDEEHRTVGRWGVHIQHIYGSSYIYTQNGVVTSFQD